MDGNDGPDLLELFRMHAQERQKEAVNLLCNEVKRLSRTKEVKRLLVLGKYAGNPELCGHVLRVLEMLPELPGMASPAYRAVLVLLFLSRDRDILCRLRTNIVLSCSKRGHTEEMLWFCEILYATGPSVSMHDICREVCLYFYLERRKQLRGHSTCVSELDLQLAEKRFDMSSSLSKDVYEEVKSILDSIKDSSPSKAYNIDGADLDTNINYNLSGCSRFFKGKEIEIIIQECVKENIYKK